MTPIKRTINNQQSTMEPIEMRRRRRCLANDTHIVHILKCLYDSIFIHEGSINLSTKEKCTATTTQSSVDIPLTRTLQRLSTNHFDGVGCLFVKVPFYISCLSREDLCTVKYYRHRLHPKVAKSLRFSSCVGCHLSFLALLEDHPGTSFPLFKTIHDYLWWTGHLWLHPLVRKTPLLRVKIAG